MPDLPTNANTQSRSRYALAQQFIADCPQELGEAIVITGSVSRGVADELSDIELRFLVAEQPTLSDCHQWLRSIGGLVEEEEDAEYEGGVQTKSWHDGVFVEALWQPWAALEARLTEIITAQTSEHWTLTEAWHIADAVPLRNDGRLSALQGLLATYPAALQERLISRSVLAWNDPHWWPVSFATIWPLALRDARLALANRLIREIERGLRILFASNERWEPDYKWLASESLRLQRKPANLVERVNALFTQADARLAVSICLGLLDDILSLVPERYDMSLPRHYLREAQDIDHLPKSRGVI